MSYFDHDYYPRHRGGLFGYLLMALIGAVLGGFFVLVFAPQILPERFEAGPGYDQVQPKQEENIPPPNMDPEEWPVVAIASRVGPAVVGITNTRGTDFFNNNVVSTGSGVIINSKKGYVVTNYHVVEGAERLTVSLDADRHYRAKLVGADRDTDLAVLQINAENLPEVKLGDSTKLKVGELAVAIGNPLGAKFARSVTVGVISALNREISVEGAPGQEIKLKVIQTDAAINPGNSGGALVNGRGELIGINSVKIARADVEGMGFAIPISDAKPIIDQLIERGYVSRPFIGIFNFREITPEMSQWYDIPVGIYVGGVVPGSPAEKAGMKAEDIIVKIDDKKIETFEDLQSVLKSHKVGDKIKVRVIRGGQPRELNITLGEMPRR